MSAYDNPHDFQVQYKKPDDLPRPEFSPESVSPGRDWRIVLVFVAFWYGFSYHCMKFIWLVKLLSWNDGMMESWNDGMMEGWNGAIGEMELQENVAW